ncbi:MAG TPA: ABC transporter permease [Gemmatimonadales bacterium]|nr:ABC transporter permease [Gemmatimonadales bacterium]
MTAWLLRRLAASVAIVFAVVSFVFILIHLAPGDPCVVGTGERITDPDVCRQLIRQFGLDRPVLVQYWRYLGEVARGNFGYSFALHRPVRDALADTMPFTLQLAGAALLVDFGLGLALGVYQALRLNRLPDVVLGNVTLFVYSLPTFWLGLLLLLVFGEKLPLFPVGGASDPVLCPLVDSLYCLADRFWHLILPAATLGLVGAAGTARFQRAAMLEVANQEFVRTARAKGLPERRVVLHHQLRNALLSFITRFGLTFPFLLTGAVLIETIFAWPGMGRLTVDAILHRDYAVVTATALIASSLVVAGNLLADVLVGFADPRIRVHEDALVDIATA